MAPKRPFKPDDLYSLQYAEDAQISPDGRLIAFVKATLDKLGNRYDRHIWLADLSGPKPRLRQFTFGAKSDTTPRWSPDGKRLAFVSARGGKPQIHLIGLDGGEARAVTSLPNGATGPAWSPDGKRLAFSSAVNAEERGVEDRGETEAPAESALAARHRDEVRQEAEKRKSDPRLITRLPYRTGTEFYDDRFNHLYVIDVPAEGASASPHRVTEGDMSFNDYCWSADGRSLFSTQAREPEYDPWHKHDVVRINASGPRRPFKRLTRPGYEYGLVAASPDGRWVATLRFTTSGSWGAVPVLCLVPANGGPVRPLTEAFDRSIEEFIWSADSRFIYFRAGDRGYTPVYRIEISSGRVETLAAADLMAQSLSLAGGSEFTFTACSEYGPAALYVRPARGEARRLTDFNADFFKTVQPARTERVAYKARDGREIEGWLLKPPGFKPGRKYPLIVNMHGGPHVMWGPGMAGMWPEWQAQAAAGYLVFFCNPRGSDGYGSEFASVIQSDWGDEVMRDVLTGVDLLAGRGYVDTKRIALTGGSYAGYMTAWIVAHDHRFACAWTQRGLYNLISFYGTSDIPHLLEREFDLAFPHDDLEKSWRHSPLAYARDIRTPLAIEHQENDYRCPISEAEQLFTVLHRLKRDVLFVRYPREGHEMSRSGEPAHRVDRLERMISWFDKYCKRR